MKFWIAGLTLLVAQQSAWGQAPLRLKHPAGLRRSVPGGVVERLPASAHYVLLFRDYPGAEVRAELARRQIRIVGYVPDSALMVSTSGPADLSGLGVTWAGPLETSEKISPLLAESQAGAYVVVFHGDIEQARARELVVLAGLAVLNHPDLLPGEVLAGGSYQQVTQLAARDEVAYILPASADLVAGNPVIGCAGPLTEAGPVGEYAEVGRGWSKDSSGVASLRYFFQSLTEKLDENTARSEIERAFREWERYANVSLSPGDRAEAARTIAIRFARGSHGDGYAFDGPGRVLAHTFYPSPPNSETIAGDIHFDADESWRAGANLDLFSVALHEAGHALGLGHSDRPGSVMYPYYRFSTGLTDDDIAGIRDLYGSRNGDPPVTPPVEPPVTPPTTPSDPPVTPPTQPPTTPGKDTTAPGLKIVSPGTTIISTGAASLRVSGTASDNVGVTEVRYSTASVPSTPATGTTAWYADVPLLVGTNVVTIRAYDAAGNSSWRAVTVVRR